MLEAYLDIFRKKNYYLLNGKYVNTGLKRAPFYQAGCWDASFTGPQHFFIRNAFNLN